MTQAAPPRWQVPIDESKVAPEVAQHLRLIYDRLINHANAVSNLQSQIDALKGQQGK
jgi:hypothetical protein